MGQEAWRAYVEMALGFTDASRKKATKAVKRLLGKGGATAEQLQGLAEDLLQTSAANRDALTKLVRFELDRALGKVGLATADEVADLTARVQELEGQLREARAAAASGAGTAGAGGGNGAPTGDIGVTTNGAEPSGALGETVSATVTTPTRKVAKKALRRVTEPASPAEPATRAPARRTTVTPAAAPEKATAKRTTAKRTTPRKAAATELAASKAVPARSTRQTARTRTADTGTAGQAAKQAPAKRATGRGGTA
jgi:polyhydroxyalkanoate synthesis regulator phasin